MSVVSELSGFLPQIPKLVTWSTGGRFTVAPILRAVSYICQKKAINGIFGHAHICFPSYAALSGIFLIYQDKMVSILGIVTGCLYIHPQLLYMWQKKILIFGRENACQEYGFVRGILTPLY